jgi:hypothetical protein
MNLNDEKTMIKLILVVSVFTLIVVSGTIGAVFMAFGLIYALFLYVEKKGVYEFSRGYYQWVGVIGIGSLALFAFLAFNGALMSVINNTQFSLFSSIPTFSTQQSVLVNINNPFVREIVWGIMIPILESLFFIGFVGKQLANKLKVNKFDIANPNVWVVCLIVGATSTWFHLASNIITEQALLTYFVFFAVSMAITIKLQELKQITAMHIGVNSLSVLKEVGLLVGL